MAYATGQYFTMNGYYFAKWIDPINNSTIVYLKILQGQPRRIGIISGNKVYFDNRLLDLLGEFSIELWRDTLNYAISDDTIVNQTYKDQRDALQQVLCEMQRAHTCAILHAQHQQYLHDTR